MYTSLSPGKELETAELILVPRFIFSRGGLESAIEGPWLWKFIETPGNSANGGDSTDIQTVSRRSSRVTGIQEVSAYFNDSSLELTDQLLKWNFGGAGNQDSCLEIAGTLLLEVEPGSNASMFTILL